MDTTVRLLETQIKQRLSGIDEYEPVQMNTRLGALLDQYDLPRAAKLACLTIDTSMRHLDSIDFDVSSKNAILIGDLLSAHFYTLLADMQDAQYQLRMSEAIITVNELKSAIHHQTLSGDALVSAIINIEMTFPYSTIAHFAPQSHLHALHDALVESLSETLPSYLQHYSKDEMSTLIENVEKHLKVK